MVYVANDGSVETNPPFSKRIALFFISIWKFIVFFFKTLFGEHVNKSGSRYTRDYRGGDGGSGPDGGGPGGPQRRIGRIGRVSDVSAPPMGGCSSCG